MTDVSITHEQIAQAESAEAEAEAMAQTESESEAIDAFFGRFGTFFLDVAHTKESNETVYRKLEEAIRADSRVTELPVPEFRAVWTRTWTSFPAGDRSAPEALLSGSDHFHPLEITDPIAFEVHVPTKNQPVILEADDVPTDTYWAVWDGITLVVLWKREATSRRPPRSAGHVVEDIIRQAASSIGARMVVQACSAGCTNMFAHRSLRIDQFGSLAGGKASIRYDGSHSRIVGIHLHFDGAPLDVAKAIYSRIENPCTAFARFKNTSRRIIDIETLLRNLVDELLVIDFERLQRTNANLFKRAGQGLKSAWRITRGGQSESRRAQEITGSIWIAMSRIEALRRDWLQLRRRFTDNAALEDRDVLFDIDRKDDELAVPAIDIGFARAAVEHRSARRDSRVIGWATLGGGIAGAAAAIATAALTAAGGS